MSCTTNTTHRHDMRPPLHPCAMQLRPLELMVRRVHKRVHHDMLDLADDAVAWIGCHLVKLLRDAVDALGPRAMVQATDVKRALRRALPASMFPHANEGGERLLRGKHTMLRPHETVAVAYNLQKDLADVAYLSAPAATYLAGALMHLSVDLLEIAGRAAFAVSARCIVAAHIVRGVEGDDDWSTMS